MSTYRYKVAENRLLTSSVRRLLLSLEEGSPDFLYEPGQYIAISLHDKLRPTPARCFSVSSSPTDRRLLEIAARVKGKYTSALQRLEVGDEVAVQGPFGSFVFKEHLHDDVVMFAGGIGITPFMSMIRYATALGLQSKIHLVYSFRNRDDAPFLEELLALRAQNPNFRMTLAITGKQASGLDGIPAVHGRLDQATIRSFIGSDKTAYMICGPAAFISSVRGLLRASQVPPHRILSEAFAQDSSSQSEALIRWPMNAYALAGTSLLLSGFLIAMADLNKTLPVLQENVPIVAQAQGGIVTPGGDLNSKIASIPPQVPTDTAARPTVAYNPPPAPKNNPTPKVSPAPMVHAPAPTSTAPAPVVIQKPVPAPIVTPAPRPRTRVS